MREAERCFDPVETIWVLVRKKQANKGDAISIPLYHQSSGSQFSALVDVDVDTNLPVQHWLLRGVKFSSSRPLNIDPNLLQ